MIRAWKKTLPFFSAGLMLLLCSCSTIISSRSQKEVMIRHFAAGDYKSAEEEAMDYLKRREGTGDELMWLLECGTIKFTLGKHKESLEIFEQAEILIDDYETRALINLRDIVSEVGAAYTNPNALPYEGNYAEKILLHAYKALNYYALGEMDAATVELRRAYARQKMAEDRFRDEIMEIEQQEEICEGGYKVDKSIIFNHDDVKKDLEWLKKNSNSVYGNFVNPFVTYLSAVNYLSEQNYNDAIVDFRNLYRMDKTNRLFRTDLASVLKREKREFPPELADEKPANHSLHQGVVYVILENGQAPARNEKKVELILPSPIGYTGFAYPTLEYYPTNVGLIKISTPNSTLNYETVPISNMDSIIAQSLDQEFPVIVTRIITSIIVKEATSIALQEAAGQIPRVGEAARLGVLLATSIWKKVFNHADTRCWQTLPKEYCVTHFPKPDDEQVQINLVSKDGYGSNSATVKLKKNSFFNIIYVKTNGYGSLDLKVFDITR